MAKKTTFGELYNKYFYENGEILKGGAFLLAYKHFILDAYNGEIIITVDGDDIVPKKEKTPANIQDFQRRFDR
ncbi:MAG: hypothetical protein KBS59_03845, partial [Clostridiales bacterium]|nr:hypothetical protein [Clostridiales bacterium]